MTRFAPSPTGYLHLGHVINAIYTWGLARRLKGAVILRIEDHDRGRSRPKFESAILEDIEWLGFEPDAGHLDEFRAGGSAFRQSNHPDRYEDAARLLADRTYWCGCSRKDIAARSGASDELRYPGTCRDRGLEEGPDRGLRLRLEPDAVDFVDHNLGPRTQIPLEQCGDLLLKDRGGNWTYQFAVTVDDLHEKINMVVRGADLLESTGRQIMLARRLGRNQPPSFFHHPLIMDDDGRKLSKRNQDTGVRELREAGVGPEEVLGKAALLGGLVADVRELSTDELPELFEGLVSDQ